MQTNNQKILLAHGSGGSLMHELVEKLFKKSFSNEILDELADSAVIKSLPREDSHICFTTDSYTVTPLSFPGGDIGRLAVCGTVNDLAVMGARPLYLSLGFIIEEGLDYEVLETITQSIAKTAREEKVKIVTGDFKVVEKGSADKMFINTSGIGIRDKKINLSRKGISPGDKIIINGSIGDHGLAVLSAREGFDFQTKVASDCAPLTGLIEKINPAGREVKFMRDPTRGGLATTLNEIVKGMGFGIKLFEQSIPLKKEVKALCEILGFDPLYMANEGKVVVVASKDDAPAILEAMQKQALARESRIIGEVTEGPKAKVVMETSIGGHRIVDMLAGDQLPRIC